MLEGILFFLILIGILMFISSPICYLTIVNNINAQIVDEANPKNCDDRRVGKINLDYYGSLCIIIGLLIFSYLFFGHTALKDGLSIYDLIIFPAILFIILGIYIVVQGQRYVQNC